MTNHNDSKRVKAARWLSLRNNKIVQSLEVVAGQVWLRQFTLFALGIMLLAIPRLITGNYWIRIFDQALLAILLCLGLNIIAGYTGLINLGYAAFYAVGAYMWALLASKWSGNHFPFLIVFPLAGVVAGLLGGLLAWPVVSLKGDYLCIVTIAFAEILRLLLNNLQVTGASLGITAIDDPNLLFYTLKSVRDYYYFLLAMAAIMFFLINRLEKSRIGRALTAIREDEEAAGVMGLNAARLKVLACAIGAVPAGMAGVIFAGLQTFVSPVSFSMWESIGWIAMVIIGGVGNAPGVALGAAVLTIATEPLRAKTESYRMLIFGGILTLFALLRPEGIWPKRYRVSPETESLAADNSAKVPD